MPKPGAPNASDDLETFLNNMRRDNARGRLLMFELVYAFDRFDKMGARLDDEHGLEPTHQEGVGKTLRVKVEAIRAHLGLKR